MDQCTLKLDWSKYNLKSTSEYITYSLVTNLVFNKNNIKYKRKIIIINKSQQIVIEVMV